MAVFRLQASMDLPPKGGSYESGVMGASGFEPLTPAV